MRVFFQNPTFDAQLLRVISHTYTGSADIGECLSTASRIKEGDFDSWQKEWIQTAERLEKLGMESEKKGYLISAQEYFLRASNYYRTSLFFHYSSPLTENTQNAFLQHGQCFDLSMKHTSDNYRKVRIPFEKTHLPGYFFKAADEKRPIIIVNGGYDTTFQEGFYAFAPMAVKRGFHVITFDGPGQGALLFKESMPMRADWESVIAPVVDYLIELPEVDNEQIILYGPSWGGMLTPIAAAFEKRLAALITNPGQWDVMTAINQAMDTEEKKPDIEAFLQFALQDKYFAKKIHTKMFIHQCQSPTELVNEWKQYNLAPIVEKITCPTFVAESENEPYSSKQATLFYEALTCTKHYHLFTNSTGSGEHCSAGALGYLTEQIFDWLEEVVIKQKAYHAN